MKRVRVIYGKGLRDYILLIAYGFPPWSIKTLSSTFLTGLGRCTWWTSPSAACLWLHACTLFQLRGKLLGFLLFGKGLLKWCLGFSNPWAKLIEVSHAAVKDGVRRNPRPHSWGEFVSCFPAIYRCVACSWILKNVYQNVDKKAEYANQPA